MTTLRIAHAEPRPGRLASGGLRTRGDLVVRADDAGHRAVTLWVVGAGFLAGPGRIERREAELTRVG